MVDIENMKEPSWTTSCPLQEPDLLDRQDIAGHQGAHTIDPRAVRENPVTEIGEPKLAVMDQNKSSPCHPHDIMSDPERSGAQ
jgi:hypothetical protein